MARRYFLGSEDAESDDLLHTCFVRPPNDLSDKSIIAGRWGTGKTAYMLHKTRDLDRFLTGVDPTQEQIWYIAENSLEVPSIQTLRKLFDHDDDSIRSFLEKVWETAIVTSYISQLQLIRRRFTPARKAHWNNIDLTYSTNIQSTPVWQSLKHIISGAVGLDRGSAVTDFINAIAPLTGKGIRKDIMSCIDDIPSNLPKPIVAVEPIETPGSSGTIGGQRADILITCLLNTFQKFKSVERGRSINLLVAIPWHRYNESRLDRPQKLIQHIAHIKWEKSRLRGLINRRLNYELIHSRRGGFELPGGIDEWDFVFGKHIKNPKVGVVENTFEYVLRHTHYRTRELMRFARRAAEIEANEADKSVFEVLIRKNDRIISETSVRAAVEEESRTTAKERIVEGNRLYDEVEVIVEALKNMPCPFSIDEAGKRLAYIEEEVAKVGVIKSMDMLWSCGIIGAVITANDADQARYIESKYGSATKAANLPRYKKRRSIAADVNEYGYKKQGKFRFFVFEHNTPRDDVNVTDLDKYGSDKEGVTVEWVFHPMMFEYLGIRLKNDYVVGT